MGEFYMESILKITWPYLLKYRPLMEIFPSYSLHFPVKTLANLNKNASKHFTD